MKTHGGLHMTHRLFRPKSLHFRLRRAGAVVATVSAAAISVAGLSAAPASAARSATIPATSPTVVSFTFDNQWASQMTAAAALKAHNMAGTFYIISGWIGQPGFMSLANLNTLAANGDEIGGKTVNNSDPPTPADSEALGACAYPDCPYAETIPPADLYQINTPDDAEQTPTLAQMEKTVTNAETHGGGLLALSFHQICATTTAGCDPVYSWSPTLFNNFLTWLQGQELLKGVQVKTIAQVIGGAVQPAVIAPAVPAAPVGTNAVVNPTLATADSVTPANPQCWTQNGYGTNTPSFSWSTTGGAGGGGQETISMSGLTSGDAKLLTTQDLGQCAPASVTGHSYQLSVWYKSTVPVFITVYGRAANGTWSYWTQSPTFPASAGWTQATWLTPAVPSTVTALSYGMTIPSNGTLSTSNYSLVDNGAGVPAAAAIGVQALQNPLLQTADGTGTNPACWMAAGFGTNSPTFTWSPTGGQTGGQETVNMTSWTSGDAKLVTPFDNGNCAPTVTAGGVYTMSVYYESTVPVFLTLYSRNAATGVWGYWTQI